MLLNLQKVGDLQVDHQKQKHLHGRNPEDSLLDYIMCHTEKEEVVDSDFEEEILNEGKDARREFFAPLKKKGSNLRFITTATLKLEKVICPLKWISSWSG